MAVMLQLPNGKLNTKELKKRLAQRLALWKQGLFDGLVKDTAREVEGRAPRKRKTDPDSIARAFHSRMLSGRTRSATRNLTRDPEDEEAVDPDALCSKTGLPVHAVLREKHPASRPVNLDGADEGVFEWYDERPDTIPLTVSKATVAKMANKMSGTGGPSGLDGENLQKITKFGETSDRLCEEMAVWAAWLANESPCWAAYRAFMACRLVGIDKKPGTRPIGIGEVFRRLWAKCIIEVCGKQATAACNNRNLCAGLPAGMEGAIHAIRLTWDDSELETPAASANASTTIPTTLPPLNTDEEIEAYYEATDPSKQECDPSVALFIDAYNGFNELNRIALMWTLFHQWPAGARFVFNCYKHWAQLFLRRINGRGAYTLYSKEGVTQGDPLSMLIYGLGVSPLSKRIREETKLTTQPWYADDAAMVGQASNVVKAMNTLLKFGPARGYYPAPEKSVVVCPPEREEAARSALSAFQFQYRDGHRYLGGFIGTEESKARWLKPKIQHWTRGVELLAKVAKRHPQTAYAGLTRSFQHEWAFVQRTTPIEGSEFDPVEKAITESFIPALFKTEAAPNEQLRSLYSLPVRHSGLGIPRPTETATLNYASSVGCTEVLTQSLVRGSQLQVQTYRDGLTGVRCNQRTQRQADAAEMRKSLQAAMPGHARLIGRATKTGAWLTTAPSTTNGTELSAEEFRDNLSLRFGMIPSNLPATCDGCGGQFNVSHALKCKKGGLITIRHDDVSKEWQSLCAKAIKPTAVTNEPLIHSCAAQGPATNTEQIPPATRGDAAVYGFWERGTTAIFDIRVTDTDCPSQRSASPEKILLSHEKQKRRHTLTPVWHVDVPSLRSSSP